MTAAKRWTDGNLDKSQMDKTSTGLQLFPESAINATLEGMAQGANDSSDIEACVDRLWRQRYKETQTFDTFVDGDDVVTSIVQDLQSILGAVWNKRRILRQIKSNGFTDEGELETRYSFFFNRNLGLHI